MKQKNLSYVEEKNFRVEKPVVSVLAVVEDKKSEKKETAEIGAVTKTALLNNEPLNYYMLALNKPHPCDRYGCSREAKYHLGSSYYCDDKVVSHFREIANKCHQEGFMLIEDLRQHDE